MNSLLDALAMIPDALSMPGDYTRGLLAGTPGERVGGRDLLRRAGLVGEEDNWGNFAAGMATEAATDPLTYLGAFLGGGPGASAAFARMGPRLGANARKLSGLAIPKDDLAKGGAALASEALASPAARQILHEIPEGSRFLGAGAESLNLATPQGDVVKLLRHNPKAAVGVPDVPGVIQPSRRVVHGGFEVNRVPLATGVGDDAAYAQARQMVPELNARGVDVFDLKPEDVGLIGGRPTILDMGSIDASLPFRPIPGRTPRDYRALGALGGGAGGALAAALRESGGF